LLIRLVSSGSFKRSIKIKLIFSIRLTEDAVKT